MSSGNITCSTLEAPKTGPLLRFLSPRVINILLERNSNQIWWNKETVCSDKFLREVFIILQKRKTDKISTLWYTVIDHFHVRSGMPSHIIRNVSSNLYSYFDCKQIIHSPGRPLVSLWENKVQFVALGRKDRHRVMIDFIVK